MNPAHQPLVSGRSRGILVAALLAACLAGCAPAPRPNLAGVAALPAAAVPFSPEGQAWEAVHRGNLGMLRQLLHAHPTLAIYRYPRSKAGINDITLLHYAANGGNRPCLELLLQAGAPVECTVPSSGATPLYYAACSYNPAAAALLIAHGASVNPVVLDTTTPLLIATEHGCEPMVRLLLEHGANPDLQPPKWNHRSPVFVASEKKQAGTVALLLAHGADPNIAAPPQGKCALAVARDLNTVQQLLTHGAKVDAADIGGRTALIDIADFGYFNNPTHSADLLAALIEKGADINHADQAGRTALMVAAEHWNLNAVALLLQNGAEAAKADKLGASALHRVCEAQANGDNHAILELLLTHQAAVNAKNNRGETPLHLACKRADGPAVRALIRADANVNLTDSEGRTPLLRLPFVNGEVLRELLAAGADINAAGKDGQTLLHLMAWRGKLASVQMLLRLGADRRIKDRQGSRAVDYVSRPGFEALRDVLQLPPE